MVCFSKMLQISFCFVRHEVRCPQITLTKHSASLFLPGLLITTSLSNLIDTKPKVKLDV